MGCRRSISSSASRLNHASISASSRRVRTLAVAQLLDRAVAIAKPPVFRLVDRAKAAYIEQTDDLVAAGVEGCARLQQVSRRRGSAVPPGCPPRGSTPPGPAAGVVPAPGADGCASPACGKVQSAGAVTPALGTGHAAGASFM